MRTVTIPDSAWTEYKLVDAADGVSVGAYDSYDAACEAGNRWRERVPSVRPYVQRVTSWSIDGKAVTFTEQLWMLEVARAR